MTGDAYRTVTCMVRQVRNNSLMVEVPNRQGWHPIPRALMHGADELKVSQDWLDTERTFRVREFKAEELGLA
jgi:hypothetical protein